MIWNIFTISNIHQHHRKTLNSMLPFIVVMVIGACKRSSKWTRQSLDLKYINDNIIDKNASICEKAIHENKPTGQPPVTGSFHSRIPTRDICDPRLCLSASNHPQNHQGICTLLNISYSGAVAQHWKYMYMYILKISWRIRYHLSYIPGTFTEW